MSETGEQPTPTPSSAPTDTPTDARARSGDDPLRHSRTSRFWVAVVALAILLVLLVVFIAQNTEPVDVAFLGWEGSTPLAVALLIAVVAGLLVASIAGSLRILQLRRRVRRG